MRFVIILAISSKCCTEVQYFGSIEITYISAFSNQVVRWSPNPANFK